MTMTVRTVLMLLVFVVGSAVFFSPEFAVANESASVLKPFTENVAAGDLGESFDQTRERRKILFLMGVVLLILIFATASLGIAMAIKGKQVFVAHMVTAGFTVFLAVAHAVASIVWFFPYR